MKKFLFIVLSLTALGSFGQSTLNIIPAPVKAEATSGNFTISGSTVLVVKDNGDKPSAEFLNDYLQKFYGFKLAVTKSASKNFISLATAASAKTSDNPERYTMHVTDNSIVIEGNSHAGNFYGIQTLLQLLPAEKSTELKIPGASIEDYPRFKYRGLMLDAGRHFFPVEFVKQYIDFIALHKMNTFHWHLTDDQGWRIQIKRYPKLTEVGAYRNGTIIGRYPGTGNDGIKEGGFYTQEQIKEVVKYAASRFITVIPEIELPGHASAAIAAYPELSCFPNEATLPSKNTAWSGPSTGKQVQQAWGVFDDVFCPSENTFTFLENVLNEVVQLFPSTYIHIGGDECPKTSWKRSEFCQNLIKEKGLKDEHGLQSYFIQHIEKYLNSKGRKIIGWDEILEGGLAPNASVMSWRGEEGGIEAAKQKHTVVMTPGGYVYFDHAQKKNEDSVTIGGFLPLETVYNYNPIPKEMAAGDDHFVLGAQANLWTEYISNSSKVEYMLFPRLSALSEVLWTPVAGKNYDDFQKRMATQYQRYNLWNVTYFKGNQ